MATNPSQTLPWELLGLIINQCSEWPATLAAIALTSSSVKLEAERVLYHRILVKADHSERPTALRTLSSNREKGSLVRALTVVFRRRETPRARHSWRLLFQALAGMQHLVELRVKSTFDRVRMAPSAEQLTRILRSAPFQLKTLFCNEHVLPDIENIMFNHPSLSILGLYIARPSFTGPFDNQPSHDSLVNIARHPNLTVFTFFFSDKQNNATPLSTTLRIFTSATGNGRSTLCKVRDAFQSDFFFQNVEFVTVYFTSSYVIRNPTDDWTLGQTNKQLLKSWSNLLECRYFEFISTLIICTTHASSSSSLSSMTRLRGVTRAFEDFSAFTTLETIDLDFVTLFGPMKALTRYCIPSITPITSQCLTTLRLGFEGSAHIGPSEEQAMMLSGQDTILALADMPLTRNLERIEIRSGQLGRAFWETYFPEMMLRFNINFVE